LEAVFAVAKNAEDGQFTEGPGDVVDQDVFFSEEDGRP
jgi:hypothetical protein